MSDAERQRLYGARNDPCGTVNSPLRSRVGSPDPAAYWAMAEDGGTQLKLKYTVGPVVVCARALAAEEQCPFVTPRQVLVQHDPCPGLGQQAEVATTSWRAELVNESAGGHHRRPAVNSAADDFRATRDRFQAGR